MLFLLSNCGKDNMFDCFKSTGKIVIEDRPASEFYGIILNNNLDLYLTQGSGFSISVEAGKHLQKGIKTEIRDRVLTISNENRCNWVRSYEKPMKVYVSFTDLDSLEYKASGNVYSLNTLVSDSIKLVVKEGGGSIDLHIQTWKSVFQIDEGTVDLTVHGTSNVNYISSNAYGPVDCLDLNTVFTYMNSSSTNNCYVNTSSVLDVTIENVGDVYYMGNPDSVYFTQHSSGKLIKLD